MLKEDDGTEVLVRKLYSYLPEAGPINVDWVAKAERSSVSPSMISAKNTMSALMVLLGQAARMYFQSDTVRQLILTATVTSVCRPMPVMVSPT